MLNPAGNLELRGNYWNGLELFGIPWTGFFDTIFDTGLRIFDTAFPICTTKYRVKSPKVSRFFLQNATKSLTTALKKLKL